MCIIINPQLIIITALFEHTNSEINIDLLLMGGNFWRGGIPGFFSKTKDRIFPNMTLGISTIKSIWKSFVFELEES